MHRRPPDTTRTYTLVPYTTRFRSSYSHQIGRFMIFDRLNGHRAALGLSDHGEETLFKHHARELVHARGGGRASGADDFLAHRIDRTDIINNATFELDWEGLALCQHIGEARKSTRLNSSH